MQYVRCRINFRLVYAIVTLDKFLFGVWCLALCAISICIENQRPNWIFDVEFWKMDKLSSPFGPPNTKRQTPNAKPSF